MGSKSSTVNWKYYLGIEQVFSWGPVDKVFEIVVNKRSAWTGSQTVSGPIVIDQQWLFGGPKRFGGLFGTANIRMGEDTQMPSSYLETLAGMELPAMRKLFSIIWNKGNATQTITATTSLADRFASFLDYGPSGFYWTAGSPSIPTVEIDACRNVAGWHGPVFYPEKAMIADGDQNAAHIIYECTVDQAWGGGWTEADVDVINHRAVADQLYAENFGLSFLWVAQETVDAFIENVLAHIGGLRYIDPVTGLFTLKLIRDDYDPDTVLSISKEHIVEIDNFSRRTWAQTINQIILIYSDPVTDEDASCIVSNGANIGRQGQVVPQTIRMPGIRNHALAQKVAERELRTASAPLATFDLTVDRIGYDVRRGQVIKIPEYQIETSEGPLNLENFIIRVMKIDYGQIGDESIKLSVAEDVFAMPGNSSVGAQPVLWDNPGGAPSNILTVRVIELPYIIVTQQLSPADLAAVPVARSYQLIMAKKPSGRNFDMSVYSAGSPVTAQFIEMGRSEYTPTALLNATIDEDDTVLAYLPESGIALANLVGGFMLIDDEWMSIQSVNVGAGTVTVKRSVLDAIPRTHLNGARMWLYAGSFGFETISSDRVEGETVYYRETGRSSAAETSLAAAPQQTVVHHADWSRPYPPANVKINGSYKPVSITTTFTITWARRNKELQTEDFVGWYEGDIAPPAGTTYSIQVINTATSAVLFSNTALTGTSFTYAGPTAPNVRVTLKTLQAGRNSKETWTYDGPMV